MRIDVREVTKRHGATLALDRVSFSIPQGSIAGLLGPNGAGKSTTLRVLTGLARPTQGTAEVGGLDVQRAGDAIRRRIGYQPELAPCYGEMSVSGFLEFMAGARGLDGSRRSAETKRVLAALDLEAWRDRLIRNLSKGTRQRVGIAQALLGEPELVILDEPAAGLDPAQILDLRRLLESLRGRTTVLLSTHILSEVEAVCDRVVVLCRGRVVLAGTLDELAPSGAARVSARGDGAQLLAALKSLEGAVVTETSRKGTEHTFEVSMPGDRSVWHPRVAAAVVAAGELIELGAARQGLEATYLAAVAAHREEADHAAPRH